MNTVFVITLSDIIGIAALALLILAALVIATLNWWRKQK